MIYRFLLNIGGLDYEIEEPIGWDSTLLSIKRDMDRYHGLFFGYTTELEFIGNAFTLIKTEFESRGYDGQGTIYISFDCDGSGTYEDVFVGELNFVSYDESTSDMCSVKLEVTTSATEVKTVNRQDILVDMMATESIDGEDISGNSLIDLTMHNYTLLYAGRWDSNEVKTNSESGSLVGGVNYFWQLVNPICVAFNEIGGMADCSSDGQHYVSGAVGAVTLADLSTLFTAPRSSTYTISFKLSGIFKDTSEPKARQGSYVLTFDFNDGIGPITEIFEAVPTTFYNTSLNEYTVSFDTSGSFSFALTAGQKVSFRWIVSNYQPLVGGDTYNVTQSVTYDADNFISIGEQSTYPATVTKSAKLYDAFWKAVSNATGSKDSFYSLYFGYNSAPDRSYISNGCGSYTSIANGYALRGFPISEKPIYVSLKDLFESADAIFNIGLGFELQSDGTVRCRVEDKSYFYSNNTLLAIFEDVKEYKTTILEDECYNIFELGFQDYKVEQGTEKLNTNNEFLSQYSWKTTAKNTKNTFTRRSKYVGSLYPIEFTRRNRYMTAGSKESKFDQDNFILATNRNGLDICEKAESFDTVNNIDSASEAYNLRFNLFSCLLRWSNIFNSCVSRLEDREIKFQYAALNKSLELKYINTESCEGNYNNEEFTVSQDLSFDDENNEDGTPIYEPIVYEFEYPMSWEQFKLFKQYPQGTVIFGRDGNLIQAFVHEIEYKPNEGKANYKLLRSYEQNVDSFFPVFPNLTDFEIMGVITEYYGTMSIWDTTGRGTGLYSKWALCNGNNTTPDLRGQFIVAYDERDADYSQLGNTGGAKTVTLTSAQSGRPAASASVDVQLSNTGAGGAGTGVSNANNVGGLTNVATVSIPAVNASESHENRPNYFTLAKIMYIG